MDENTTNALIPAVAVLVSNFPLTVVVLWAFYKGFFRLGSDVENSRKQSEENCAKLFDSMKEQRDFYKEMYEAELEKADDKRRNSPTKDRRQKLPTTGEL